MVRVLMIFIGLSFMNFCFASSNIDVLGFHRIPDKFTGKSVVLENNENIHINVKNTVNNIINDSKSFFDLVDESEKHMKEGNFHDAAINIIACAYEVDMGDDYRNIIYKVDPTFEWSNNIENTNSDTLSELLHKLENHLKSISKTKEIDKSNIKGYFSNEQKTNVIY